MRAPGASPAPPRFAPVGAWTLWLAAAWVGGASWGCAPADPGAGAEGGAPLQVGDGAACGASAVCVTPLLCVDGRCRPRGWAWAPDAAWDGGPGAAADTDTASDTLADMASLSDADTAADTLANPDTFADADTASAADTLADTASVPDTVADTLADTASVADTAADTASVPDTASAADTFADTASVPDTDTASDAAPDADVAPDAAPATTTLLVMEDAADQAVGQDSVALALGQAWVTTLHVPPDATLVGAQALARDSFDGESCGLFSLAIWAPSIDGGAAGPAWPDEPTWVSGSQLPLQGLVPAQLLLVPEGDQVPVPEGLVRVGLVYAAPCEGGPPPPLLVTDTSGQLGVGFLYDPGVGGVSPWIPDAFLGLQGRWALRLLVSVPAG